MLGGGKKDDDDKQIAAHITALRARADALEGALKQRRDQAAKLRAELGKLQDQQQQIATALKDAGEIQAAFKHLDEQVTALKARPAGKQAAGKTPASGTGAQAAPQAAQGAFQAKPAAPAQGAAAAAGQGAAQAVAPTGGLRVGATAWVRKAGGKNLRLRDAPGLDSNAFAGLPPGTQLTLLEGPRPEDNYTWWRIRATDGREGWVAGEELVTEQEA